MDDVGAVLFDVTVARVILLCAAVIVVDSCQAAGSLKRLARRYQAAILMRYELVALVFRQALSKRVHLILIRLTG